MNQIKIPGHPNITLMSNAQKPESIDSAADYISIIINTMNKFFNKKLSEDLTVNIEPNFPGPKIMKFSQSHKAIFLTPSNNLSWSQIAYQFSHEYCHALINSTYTDERYLWVEESFCETASKFMLTELSNISYSNPFYERYKLNFAEYLNTPCNLSPSNPWNIHDLEHYQTELTLESHNHTNRPLIDYVSTKLITILTKNPALWSDITYIAKFSTEKSLEDNIIDWNNWHPNTITFKPIFCVSD
ncbi:hypothetical protein OA78_0865 [Latilactobacillus curvatus]|uniref:hypothetical protein n=1 Tax=Latilactobacillus curvatus TaxID=28038 RepID=UPI0005739159|nr:hypothetical protein [Latilactobacillus curvatus]KHO13117.1 hypothetical protein OA78_0865 [Latilactobacillus curvatus]